MGTRLSSITIAGTGMDLWESAGPKPRYAIAFRIMAQPDAIQLIPLGDDVEQAFSIFIRKVECHMILAGVS